jgi:type II secretion system protein G
MMKLRKNQKGFTLIEVLLIVVILGIIAAIAIPRLMESKAEAQKQTCRANVANINTAIDKYYFDEGTYPTALSTILAIQAYFPDGVPKCPSKVASKLDYVFTPTTNRATCQNHGDINGGAGS